MKILITGASGLWGRFLYNFFQKKGYKVFGTYFTNEVHMPNTYKLNIVERKEIFTILNYLMPDVIIHTAAMSKVILCEQHKDIAYNINVNGTLNLCSWCVEKNKKLIFFSTDMVYNTYDEDFYFDETDEPEPSNYYAETKLIAEEKIKNTFSNFVILRVALSYGHGDDKHPSFSDWLYSNFKQGNKIPLFINQWRTPIFLGDGAKFIERIINKNLSKILFNFGGKEKVNRVQFGDIFADVFRFDKSLINPVKLSKEFYHSSSINSSMDISRIIEYTDYTPDTLKNNFKKLMNSDSTY